MLRLLSLRTVRTLVSRRLLSTVLPTEEDILRRALDHVPRLGWTTEALSEGARDLGLSPQAHGMLPRGPVQLVEYYYDQCTNDLAGSVAFTPEMRTPQKLHALVHSRLMMIHPYIRSWPDAMALMSYPTNLPYSMQRMTALVDEIWYLAGDRSYDFNWYTKRTLLAGVYGATELYMLQDRSVDYANTWQFLERRIQDASDLGKCALKRKEEVETGAAIVANTLLGGFAQFRDQWINHFTKSNSADSNTSDNNGADVSSSSSFAESSRFTAENIPTDLLQDQPNSSL